MNTYFNIHTHQLNNSKSYNTAELLPTIEILNVDVNQPDCNTDWQSAGMHPWYITPNNAATNLQLLEEYLQRKNVLAVGECGLDKICATPFPLQQEYFQAQVYLAQRYQIPLIIHCVRAYSEVLKILKSIQPTTPIIFHGFNKNAHIALQIISNGYYLSFGHALFQSERLATILQQLPLSQIFLETDTRTDYSIEAIYKKTSKLLNLEEDMLFLQLESNFRKVFPRFELSTS